MENKRNYGIDTLTVKGQISQQIDNELRRK